MPTPRAFSTQREARRTMATPASCPLCGGSFPSKNAMFKHLRDENVATAGECGSWCLKHGGVTEAARKIAAGELEEPTFSPPPPAKPRKAKASKQKASARGNRSSGQTIPRDGEWPGEDASAMQRVFVPECPGLPNELWVGGIPATHASTRRVSQILYGAIPGNVGIAVPVVRHVVRRGWRASTRNRGGGSRSGTRVVGNADAGDAKTPKGAWLGYAFVAFRDAEEAAQAIPHVDGKVIRETTSDGDPVTITLVARPATVKGMRRRPRASAAAADDDEDDDEGDDEGDDDARVPLAPGADPSRFAVARAWPRAALAGRAKALGYHTMDAYLAAEKATPENDGRADAASTATRARAFSSARRVAEETEEGVPPRKVLPLPSPVCVRVRGVPIPPRLLDDLRAALETTRWPPASHRRGVDAQKYLVLSSASVGAPGRDPYGSVKRAAFAVLRWADPGFAFDRLAVTKNFIGSPHVDKDDVTFQYALSLGDFGAPGGELVVESEDGETRWAVDTRNRVARVDGRFAHWVRGYDSARGARYSVVFYANKPSAATARLRPPVDVGFVPAGTRRDGNGDGDGDGDGNGDGPARGNRAGASSGAIGGTRGMALRISARVMTCFAAGLGIGTALRTRRRKSARRGASRDGFDRFFVFSSC